MLEAHLLRPIDSYLEKSLSGLNCLQLMSSLEA